MNVNLFLILFESRFSVDIIMFIKYKVIYLFNIFIYYRWYETLWLRTHKLRIWPIWMSFTYIGCIFSSLCCHEKWWMIRFEHISRGIFVRIKSIIKCNNRIFLTHYPDWQFLQVRSYNLSLPCLVQNCSWLISQGRKVFSI